MLNAPSVVKSYSQQRVYWSEKYWARICPAACRQYETRASRTRPDGWLDGIDLLNWNAGPSRTSSVGFKGMEAGLNEESVLASRQKNDGQAMVEASVRTRFFILLKQCRSGNCFAVVLKELHDLLIMPLTGSFPWKRNNRKMAARNPCCKKRKTARKRYPDVS